MSLTRCLLDTKTGHTNAIAHLFVWYSIPPCIKQIKVLLPGAALKKAHANAAAALQITEQTMRALEKAVDVITTNNMLLVKYQAAIKRHKVAEQCSSREM